MNPSLPPADIGTVAEQDRELFAQAAAWNADTLGLEELSVETLKAITDEQGIELATAVLYDRLRRSANHREFIRDIDERIARPGAGDAQDAIVGVIPGAMWAHYPDTGADGAWIMGILSEIGVRHERVEVPGFGNLEENARVVLNWLNHRRGRPVMLVSLSKGGCDVKMALRTSPDHFDQVYCWVSVSGSMQGSPLVRWLSDRPLRKFGLRVLLKLRGEGMGAVEGLRREVGAPLWDWPVLPDHLRLIHVMGFPLRRHLAHRWARRGYERAAPMGPNDGGGILLGDVGHWPGAIYPVWGADHYLQPAWDIAPLLRAIFIAGLRGRPAQAPAATPSTTRFIE